MAEYEKKVREVLKENGCYFVRLDEWNQLDPDLTRASMAMAPARWHLRGAGKRRKNHEVLEN